MNPHTNSDIRIPISPGELLDRLSILRIKAERIVEPAKQSVVRAECEALEGVRQRAVPSTPDICTAEGELGRINRALWDSENDIRACERDGDFGPRFVAVARSIYRLNDERAGLKRWVNNILNSDVIEEKTYVAYPKS